MLVFGAKAQTYSALFHGIQQQRREQHLDQLRRQSAAAAGAGYGSPSSTYITDDDDDDDDDVDVPRCRDAAAAAAAADFDLVQFVADRGRFHSASVVDAVSRI